MSRSDGSIYEIDGRAVNAFAVHFLTMALGLWSKGFPDPTIQGVSRKEAMRLAEMVAGRKFAAKDFDNAYRAIEELRCKIEEARAAEVAAALGSAISPSDVRTPRS